ncbi:MAG TPA: hypothetical protein VH439_17175 [Gemmatimonadales bacterium]|jgi:hypothetical protein
MTPKLDFEALDDDVKAKVAARLGIASRKNQKKRTRTNGGMSKDEVRMHARRVLGALPTLAQSEVRRVLAQASKMNDV